MVWGLHLFSIRKVSDISARCVVGLRIKLGNMVQVKQMDTMTREDSALLPWSHRLGWIGRASVTILAAAGAAVIGTLAHRMGAAANIPYGLALAFIIVALSTWCARSRLGVIGLALHLIVSSGLAWLIAVGAGSGDALIVAGFATEMPFFSQHAGYIWLYGIILIQVAMLCLPARWFRMLPQPSRKPEA